MSIITDVESLFCTSGVAKALCYELIAMDKSTVIWKKPTGDSCLPNHYELFGLELCDESDDPSYAWYFKLKRCVTRISSVKAETAVSFSYMARLTKAPARAALMKMEKMSLMLTLGDGQV